MRSDTSAIFGRSFSQHDQRKSGCFAVFICLVIGITICNFFQLYILNLKLLTGDKLNMLKGTTKETIEALDQPANQVNEVEMTCNFLGRLSDYCEMKGDIRIEAKSTTIFIVSPNHHVPGNNNSWSIKPYARKGEADAMDKVKKWTVKLVGNDDLQEKIPICSLNHSIPAILFSTGGYSENTFHSFTDLLVPSFTTSWNFRGEFQFLATDYNYRWISKYKMFFSKLSNHPIIPIDEEKERIHCYPKMVLGLKSYRELDIDPLRFSNGLCMDHFRQFLRSTYSLERTKAIKLKKGNRGNTKKPRLMLISRTRTRVIINEDEIIEMARQLGYEVIVAEERDSTNVTSFAQLVNSCDVMVGVHGAGLTNMVFLPDNAVLIQIIPFGGVEVFARSVFGRPSIDMKIIYLEYSIMVNESSLIQKYPLDQVVLRDPTVIHLEGWDAFKTTYLDQQDVRIDLPRFRSTLEKSVKILGRY